MNEIQDNVESINEDSPDFPDEEGGNSSWFIEPGIAVIKKTDRSVFLHRETTIPQEVREFFDADDLESGKKRPIVLWHGNERFDAFIEKTVHDPPVFRMIWKSDFAAVLNAEFPQWLDLFKKSRAVSEDTPTLEFTNRPEPDHYDVETGITPQQMGPGIFEVPLKAGDIIDNDTLRAIFRCSLQGAMRQSLSTNGLVLISDHTKSAYEDKWIGKVFHYTGMGLIGEQSLSLHQNKILVESKERGIGLYLFEVFHEGNYVYIGEVELPDRPYRSRQPDSEKNLRDVYIFPLRLKGNKHPPLLKKTRLEIKAVTVPGKSHKLPMNEPEFHASSAFKESGKHSVTTAVYKREPLVLEYAKRRANGICQLCNRPAPFATREGEPFLEVHHIVSLEEGGPDTIGNVVALCPNCSRKMQMLNLPADVARLRNASSKRE